MNKKIILFIYLLTYLVSSLNIFTENEASKPRFNIIINSLINSNKNIDSDLSNEKIGLFRNLKEEMDYTEKEKLINNIFSDIRRGRNNIVKRNFKTKENLKILEERKSNNDTFLYPASDYSLYPYSNIDLIDINAKNKIGYTALIVAIESQNNTMVEYLLDNGADIYVEHPVFNKMSLHTAAYFENYEAVKMILERYPDVVNFHSGYDGWLPLQDATLKNNELIVKFLLEKGADPRLEDYKGGTAIDMATEFGKGKVVKLLRDKMKEIR